MTLPPEIPSADSPPRLSWRKAVGSGLLVAYAPFVAMTFYTLLFVSCQHCKTAAVTILPIGPGLLPGYLTLDWLRVPDSPRVWAILVFCAYTLLAVLLMTVLMRIAGRWWLAVVGAGLIGFGVLAVMVLGLIRA